MSGLRGVFVGVLALVALEALVSTEGAADRTTGLLGTVAQIVQRVLDPNVAAIPDRRAGAAPSVPLDSSTDQPAPTVDTPPATTAGKYKPTKAAG